jgi:acetyl esterase/lipase
MLYAYNYDKRNVVSSIISLGGPTKLDDRSSLAKSKAEDVKGLLPLITGKPWSNDSLDIAYRLASPWYGHHLKPSLVIHGEVDTIVSWLQAQLMSDKLTSEGVDNQFFLIKNGWHGGEGASKETTDSLNITVNHWVQTHS